MMPGTPQQDDDNRKVSLPDVPDRCGPPSISLAQLLDFAIQHTYHELTVLTELLPKQNDAAKKISIVQFAHSTRLKFVKLLAIVILTVPGEFEASLTLLGESTSINWTLLNIRNLVEDHEIDQGTKLVHPLQLNLA
uniref:Mediator of RNA polymerase II transcription subunit 14 n=1 Tax=Acrobeloides nanus TaxID=290746 RepID=A0A914CRN8_9BILA